MGRRRPGRDRGSFTAEFAAGLPALILLLLAGLTAVVAVTAKGQCVDAAREGALAGSRGEPAAVAAGRVAPAGADVEVDEGEETVTAVVRARVSLLGAHLPVITVTGRAVAAREPALVDGGVS
ncbi:TadE family type IV pilus minor pilin [Paractinoplanes toevensis]|uniref:TadE family type IV pilus minor pilin n=1 Tax=Paractinoplanes toevensis TaxID=571911 RepID=UPI003F68CE91